MNMEEKAKAINSKISSHIAYERKKLRLTRADFANKIEVKQYMVAKWESGNHDFTISEL